MNEKEIAELRRRFRQDKSSITHVRGCYVNENREIISEFDQSLTLSRQEDAEKILAVLRKTLSGAVGRNLLDIEFDTRQVVEGDEHRLLMALRDSRLADQEAVHALFRRVIASLDLAGNYLILLAYDAYDVPYRSKDGQRQDDASDQVFTYILCAVCPVKLTKDALSYYIQENQFRSVEADWVVAAPEVGFLFPAFDDRATNLYNALYYTRDISQSHPDFVDALFKSQVPMPAAVQKETFQSILGDTLEEECRYEVVQAVHDELCGMIAAHKESKEEDPLVISKVTVKQVLHECGVSPDHVERFEEQYDRQFGPEADLPPRNIVDEKQLEVKTPDVTIKVSPERSDLVETRVIDGRRYILIRAEEGVEVNGVQIHIS
ncbi:DUF4317 domain-containing protein [Dysosmobacter sp. Sow4_B12]|uniref:DUF4317 domain-containing protein n=1 Tax=Dysosmobacter sp. Sow4_B12 TaxID=3438777 RepID=UPI003F91EF1D